MAMVIRETLGAAANLDIKVLATDIDTNVLEHAREGVYVDDHVEPVSAARRKRSFTPAATAGSTGRQRFPHARYPVGNAVHEHRRSGRLHPLDVLRHR